MIAGIFFFGCQDVNAATMYLSSSATTVAPGESVTLYVILNSQEVAINNAEAVIKFPTDLFEVLSVSKGGSIFSIWVEDPSFSNSTGTVSFNGGVPTPGFTGPQGSIISIVARAKKVGQANFSFSSGAVRANDGLGTNVLSGRQGKTITVISKDEPKEAPVKTTPKEEPAETTSKEEELRKEEVKKEELATKTTLQVSSPTHPREDQWYDNASPKFKWNLPTGVDAVQTSIGNSIANPPKVIYSPPISEKFIKDLEDGVWYFKIRARKDGVWGPVLTYVVNIDTTAPEKNEVTFDYDDTAKILKINAEIQDQASGMDYYEIFVNDLLVKDVPAKEFVNGKYNLELEATGDNTVKLLAVDRAGNSVETLGSFYSAAVKVPKVDLTLTPKLDSLPSLIPANKSLLISGTTKSPNTDVIINIKQGDRDLIVINTKSNFDLSFAVATPKLMPGDYEIWAEVDSVNGIIASKHLFARATSDLLITVGSTAVKAFYVVILIFVIIILLVFSVFYFGRQFSGKRPKSRIKTVVVKQNDVKMLSVLKKHLEKQLDLLQSTRHARILTKQEKEIKKTVESDLDEIDKAIGR